LDIVTNSIYTDKEVFLRELISNASDALEKYRYKQVLGEVTGTSGVAASAAVGEGGETQPLEINIVTDPVARTLTVTDNGIGMTRDELISNLGTIARSGSKQFVQQLKDQGSGRDTDGIIGQFGVGFYSSFMVSDTVSVESRSASLPAVSGDRSESTSLSEPEISKWSSDGSGMYTIESIPASSASSASSAGLGLGSRGSHIVLHLKESCADFADADRVKDIIKRYSSFVSFPVKVNGEAVNTVSAIWVQDKKTVTTAQYDDFYKFIANAFDKPKYTLHFRADAPLDLKCLFFVPSFHTEKFGMGRMEAGVNLYSRKVLIESKPKDLLPEWLRFVKGVVDSEDLPLSLSREKPQDSQLLKRIRDVLTRKLIRFLDGQARDDPAKFKEFYIEYNYFLKEGVCHDYKFMDQIAKLLYFESSALDAGMLSSLDEYVSRCPPEQKEIYYLVAPSREVSSWSHDSHRQH